MAFRQTEAEGSITLRRFILHATCICALCLIMGCGSVWQGRIVHLEDGRILIRPESDGEIESGQKVRIRRLEIVTHPITGEVLGNIEDEIAEVPVLQIRGRTVTAAAGEREFDMMEIGDIAVSSGGSVKPFKGSARAVGKLVSVDTEGKAVEIAVAQGEQVKPGETLAVIRYAGTVTDPDTGAILAVSVEPVANLSMIEAYSGGHLRASYDLIDEKLGWIEVDDTVVKRTGDMLAESLWFQDPPDGFSQAQIFGRKYLHAVEQYDSGQYREAILELKDVVQLEPGYGESAYILGLCYANLNRHEEAIKLFQDILAQKPDDAKTLASLAYAYMKQGKPQEAVKIYERLARVLPDNSSIWTDIGDIYLMLEDQQKAEQSYKKALEIDESNAEAAYELQKKGG